jgi:hypothetical protein
LTESLEYTREVQKVPALGVIMATFKRAF